MAKYILSDFDFGSAARILNLPQSTANGQPVTHEQLLAAIEGMAWKDSVRVATTANVNLASPGATVDGITMVAGDRVLVKAQTLPEANGIYVWNGAAVAMTRAADANSADEVEQATVIVEEGTNAGTAWRQTAVNVTLGTTALTFVQFGATVPPASTSTAGTVVLATQSEVNTGTDTTKVVTCETLAGSVWAKKKVGANFGDGSATQYDITHNLNTYDVTFDIFRNSGARDSVLCDVSRPDVNTLRLNFAVAPTTNQFRIVVIA